MLNKLTKEQEKLMYQVKQEWLDRFFSCKNKLNRDQCTEGIKWLYKFCKYKEPYIVYVSSPYAAQFAVHYAKKIINALNSAAGAPAQVGDQVRNQVWNQVGNQVRAQVGDQVRNQVRAQVWNQVGDQVRDQVWDQVGAQVRNQVWDQVGNQVGDQVRNQVWDQVWNQVGDQVRDQVGDQVGNQVGDQVRNQVRAQVWNQVGDQVWNQVGNQVRADKFPFENFSSYGNVWDYGWLGFYDFFRRIGIEFKNTNFDSFMQLIKSNCYDMIQLDGLCVVCELPASIKRNPENRLHSTISRAIEWSDGYGLHFVNGRNVPSDKFLQAQENRITKKDWLTEKNEDVKAAWFEILGSEKVMQILEAQEIDSEMRVHANGEMDDLKLYKTPFILEEIGEPLAWVRFICPSTGSNYLISVNPKHNKVMSAVLDTCPFYGEEITSEKEYQFNARG